MSSYRGSVAHVLRYGVVAVCIASAAGLPGCSPSVADSDVISLSALDAISLLERDGYTLVFPENREVFSSGYCPTNRIVSLVKLKEPDTSYTLNLDETCHVVSVEHQRRGNEL